jgi:hypothetical protein
MYGSPASGMPPSRSQMSQDMPFKDSAVEQNQESSNKNISGSVKLAKGATQRTPPQRANAPKPSESAGDTQLEIIVDLETLTVSEALKTEKLPENLKLVHPFVLDCKLTDFNLSSECRHVIHVGPIGGRNQDIWCIRP